MPNDTPLTRSLARLAAVIAALHDGPLDRHTLLARLGAAYPHTTSARRMLDRDIAHLHTLGTLIERDSRTRPPIYTLRGGTPR